MFYFIKIISKNIPNFEMHVNIRGLEIMLTYSSFEQGNDFFLF